MGPATAATARQAAIEEGTRTSVVDLDVETIMTGVAAKTVGVAPIVEVDLIAGIATITGVVIGIEVLVAKGVLTTTAVDETATTGEGMMTGTITVQGMTTEGLGVASLALNDATIADKTVPTNPTAESVGIAHIDRTPLEGIVEIEDTMTNSRDMIAETVTSEAEAQARIVVPPAGTDAGTIGTITTVRPS